MDFRLELLAASFAAIYVPRTSFFTWRVAYVWHEFAERPFDHICYHCLPLKLYTKVSRGCLPSRPAGEYALPICQASS